ncbi:recombinase family protein, partial [Aquimarina sp. I32.4]|uniref:recombinase family protein n=1 Tax=Aquimarina sp. I32.4 TaxID=2053903 RepID=UPI001304AAA0
MENLRVFQKFGKKSNKPKVNRTNKAVIYTRVSTKEQAVNNASLETQKVFCDEYAKRNQLEVVQYFGGTYESAKKDDRIEFQKMLKYVRRNHDISYIIVYAYDRFSRSGASGANISNQLKEQGVLTLSATQHVDFNNAASSVLGEGVFHLMSHLENVNRSTNITNGMRTKLLKGYWINTVPFGYTNLNPGKGKTPDIVINEKGKLLKLAFQWKLHKNMTYREIAERIERKGVKIRAKKLSDYFRNPFYCGVIVHNLLEEPIIGKHEP